MGPFGLVLMMVVMVGSMLIVSHLASKGGRRSLPWVVTASLIGPFAIPLLFLADAASALRKRLWTHATPK